jgi:predicted ATPase
MTRISAIEIENFQSIQQHTRIDLKPITLLFGPNSAGKSSIFDALELLGILLDPTKFNNDLAKSKVDRWARRTSDDPVRKTFLAVEFPFNFVEFYELWGKDSNWPDNLIRTHHPKFYWDYEDSVKANELEGATVRIELHIEIINKAASTEAYLSECLISLKDLPLLRISKKHPTDKTAEEFTQISSDHLYCDRWLTVYDTLSYGFHESDNSSTVLISTSLRPLSITKSSYANDLGEDPKGLCRIASDAFFYFGTILFMSKRDQPGIVMSDRRAPKPSEALTVVDLRLKGWWSRSSFSASSPASLLKSISNGLDEHYQGLAEITHAELLLRTASTDFWGSSHAAKHIEPIRNKARILDIVNHHLEKNLFSEKLYKLSCAATLMVPIDLNEEDPWSYYALAQPAAVRLFLKDGEGQNVDFHDVGSGIPFVLPILYAVACQGFVKVQQPELHLHPALQSSLADVFVEELNRSGSDQFLIETHSEHFLLRLLRRIRDSERNKCLSTEMKLTNKDLAVYYFDPQVSGGTVVTQQLVTPLGDFYTDWPRGFFAERNRDLFDE